MKDIFLGKRAIPHLEPGFVFIAVRIRAFTEQN